MTPEERRQVALFRYALVAPLLHCPDRGALQALLEQAAAKVYDLPGGEKRRASVRTLERHLAAFRKGGFDALFPQERTDRHRPRALPTSVIDRAVALRLEQPARTVTQLIAMLEMEGTVRPDTVKRSTLSTHLKQAGLSRAKATRKSRTWQRYTASRVHEVWQCDVCDSLRVPDPQSGQMPVARLIAVLDDKSRYICEARYYFRENLPSLEETLKRAIARSGTPEIFYCDYTEKNTMPKRSPPSFIVTRVWRHILPTSIMTRVCEVLVASFRYYNQSSASLRSRFLNPSPTIASQSSA